MKMVSGHRRKVDLRLEIHPFSRDEVEPDLTCQPILKGMRANELNHESALNPESL